MLSQKDGFKKGSDEKSTSVSIPEVFLISEVAWPSCQSRQLIRKYVSSCFEAVVGKKNNHYSVSTEI